MQLEMGISTSLYLPAMGTAGLDRLAVSGYNLEPAPPPSIMLRISFEIDICNQVFKVTFQKVSKNCDKKFMPV
jgi:hypothetical protein